MMKSDQIRINHAMATERETAVNRTTLDPAWQRFAAYVRARNAEVVRQTEAEAARSRAEAEAIAAMLRERFGATRVILFGSLARGRFRLDSDIDLAVTGIPTADFFRAYAEAMSLAGEFKLDLLDLADCPPSVQTAVLKQGIPL